MLFRHKYCLNTLPYRVKMISKLSPNIGFTSFYFYTCFSFEKRYLILNFCTNLIVSETRSGTKPSYFENGFSYVDFLFGAKKNM